MNKPTHPPEPLSPAAAAPQGTGRMRIPLALPVRPYLRDHHFSGKAVLPAAEILQHLAGSLQACRPGASVHCMRRASFDRFLEIGEQTEILHAWHELDDCESGGTASRLMSTGVIPGTAIRRTKVHAAVDFAAPEEPGAPLPADLASALQGIAFGIPSQVLYRDLVPFGPAFQNVVDTVFLNENGVMCRVFAAAHPAPAAPLGSPFPLDGTLHAACAWGQRFHNRVTFPVGFEERRVFHPTVPGERYHGIILPLPVTGDVLRFDIWILNGDGELFEALRGVAMKDVTRGRLRPPDWVLSREASPLARIRGHSRALSVIDLSAVAPFAARALSPQEQDRFQGMGKARRQSFLAGRLALKHLARMLAGGDRQTPASAIHTIMPDERRPRCCVPGGPTVFCSLSHDRRYAVAVADDEAVGVDVEQISARVLKAGRLFMGPEELALAAASPLGGIEASMRVWSCKEAVAKMTDRPLAACWASVRIQTTGPDESRLLVDGTPYRAVHDTVEDHLFTLVKKGDGE